MIDRRESVERKAKKWMDTAGGRERGRFMYVVRGQRKHPDTQRLMTSYNNALVPVMILGNGFVYMDGRERVLLIARFCDIPGTCPSYIKTCIEMGYFFSLCSLRLKQLLNMCCLCSLSPQIRVFPHRYFLVQYLNLPRESVGSGHSGTASAALHGCEARHQERK